MGEDGRGVVVVEIYGRGERRDKKTKRKENKETNKNSNIHCENKKQQ